MDRDTVLEMCIKKEQDCSVVGIEKIGSSAEVEFCQMGEQESKESKILVYDELTHQYL